MKTNQTRQTLSILLLCILVLLIAIPIGVVARGNPAPSNTMAAEAAVPQITGAYAGSVTINEPAPLGALDLALNLIDTGGALSGQVNAARTQVFLGGPTFTGSVTASQGITPTFRIDSAVFAGIVSGRSVQRQFALTGEILNEANTLRGQYTETITGFTPHPLLVKGRFLLVRPNGSQVIPAGPGSPVTATPTATATATTNPSTPATATSTATATATTSSPGGGSTGLVYMPVVINNREAVLRADAGAASTEQAPVGEATATPEPAEPTATPQPMEGAATPAAAQVDEVIYLPVVVR
ncbi:MAG: hypothetical protein KJZ93_31220 [Caldilineaceae bacterium]|nr:hypothetical protein [Caldilineaceae bacterium]